jgi:acetyl esterase/lipase
VLQSLDLYLFQAHQPTPMPLLLWIHGGGFRRGTKENPGPILQLVLKGYALASIAYRYHHVAKFPAQIQDVQAALRWLRAHAADYHIDPARVGAAGSSAGGMLANLMGAAPGAFPPIGEHREQDDRVQAVCAYCGPTDVVNVRRHAHADPALPSLVTFNSADDPYSNLLGVPLGQDIEKEKAASPLHHVRRRDDQPAWLLIHGTADQHVPFAQAADFAAALRAAGADVLLQPLRGGDHKTSPYFVEPMMDLVQRFFDRSLKGAAVDVTVVPDEAIIPPEILPTARTR